MTFQLFQDPAALAPPAAVRVPHPAGGFVLRHPEPLQPYARCIGAWLEHWAVTTPDALFLAERDAHGEWRRLSYRHVREQVGRVAQALLAPTLTLDTPAGPSVTLPEGELLVLGGDLAYPGASASVLVDAALIPLERAINGVQGMKYMVSDATSAGEATIQVVFELGTDPNLAVVNVKTRIDQVMNQLPPLVQLEGVVVAPVHHEGLVRQGRDHVVRRTHRVDPALPRRGRGAGNR